jgi:hypothetical protein
VDPRFRPTLWPGNVVPTPPIRSVPRAAVRGDWIVWPPGQAGAEAELPPDFYLREMLDVEADDLEAVAGLMRAYGPLCDLELTELDLTDYEPEERHKLADLADYPDAGDSLKSARGGIHRDLVRLFIESIQRATRTYLSCQSDGGLEELVAPNINDEYLNMMRQLNSDLPTPWPTSLEHLRKLLIEEELGHLQYALGAALSRFSVGFGDLEDRWPSIYSVSFLQLYNHVAEGSTARRCANETCRRAFVRQRGRAEYAQYRTDGVKYCSRECARAQAQRQLRRRRKLTVVNRNL